MKLHCYFYHIICKKLGAQVNVSGTEMATDAESAYNAINKAVEEFLAKEGINGAFHFVTFQRVE